MSLWGARVPFFYALLRVSTGFRLSSAPGAALHPAIVGVLADSLLVDQRVRKSNDDSATRTGLPAAWNIAGRLSAASLDTQSLFTSTTAWKTQAWSANHWLKLER